MVVVLPEPFGPRKPKTSPVSTFSSPIPEDVRDFLFFKQAAFFGKIAAAGLVALDTMIERLQEDHDHARHMASRMAEMPGISVDPERIQTNLIRFGVPAHKGNEIAARLKEEGVFINGGDSDLRIVSHYGVSSADYDFTMVALGKVMNALKATA